MKVAIMQPYFLPYIGYFQLVNAVDTFVIYDNIEFTKKGWIHRNRLLVNGSDDYLTLPLKKDSDFLPVNQRVLATTFASDKIKMLRKIKELYIKAPQFKVIYPMFETIVNSNESNLFHFIFNALQVINDYLEIKTKIIISSSVPVNHELKSQEKVLAICKALEADSYLNAIGGLDLYSKEMFETNEIKLNFIKSNSIVYQQFDNEFVPWLSILDVLFFNTKEKAQEYLQHYTII
jgi:hypothetical protein